MNFTDKQIEYIKNASDHVKMLCGGRGQGKTHQLINEMQDKINNLQSKIDKAIKKLEYYNSGEALYYVPIQDIIDILKED